jgi:hypothetical protein
VEARLATICAQALGYAELKDILARLASRGDELLLTAGPPFGKSLYNASRRTGQDGVPGAYEEFTTRRQTSL